MLLGADAYCIRPLAQLASAAQDRLAVSKMVQGSLWGGYPDYYAILSVIATALWWISERWAEEH
jgi:hypothetical protein